MLHLKGGEKGLTKVELRPGESQQSLLRRFRKKVARSRILSTVKKKRYFVSDSEKRRIARRKAVRREQQRRQKEEERYGY
jgi:small subunit ribosomal protein S21